jgi:hypothetical protein
MPKMPTESGLGDWHNGAAHCQRFWQRLIGSEATAMRLKPRFCSHEPLLTKVRLGEGNASLLHTSSMASRAAGPVSTG